MKDIPYCLAYIKQSEDPEIRKNFNKSYCSHKYPDGAIAMVENKDGSFTCKICGDIYKLEEIDQEKQEKFDKIMEEFDRTRKNQNEIQTSH